MIARILTVVAALTIGACTDDRLPEYELTGPVMGTSFSVKLVDLPADVDRDELGGMIATRLEDIEQRFSTYRPSSELSQLNDSLTTKWIPVSEEICELVESAIELSKQTNGAFDITVGPLVLLWGFGPGSDRGVPPVDQQVQEARNSVGYEKLETDCTAPALRKELPGISIDLSAFAKGYAVDSVTELLVSRGFSNFLVEIGGELCMRGRNAGNEPWAIAIEKADAGPRDVQTIVSLTDRCMATSGDYRNFFEHEGVRYSHTIDPSTGRPVTHDTAAVTVVAGSAATADALATALLVLGVKDGSALADRRNIAAYFVVRTDDGFAQSATASFERLLR